MNLDVTTRRWAGQEIEHRAPSASFLDAIAELIEGDERLVVLYADGASRLGFSNLAAETPDRILAGGSAEQNLVGMAVGLAALGKIPVVVTGAVSASLTAARLLLLEAAHGDLHIVIAGFPSGLVDGEGAVAHGLVDLATFGAMPRFRVVAPTDAEETAKALITLVDEPGPGYLRLTDEPRPVINGPDSPFDLGRAVVLRDGQELTLVACGTTVYEALVAADLLEEQGTSARVVAVHSIEPFDTATIEAAARETGALVVIEEHGPQGGLGARVAALTGSIFPVPVEHLHTGAAFIGSGSIGAMRQMLGLEPARIVELAQRAAQRKT
jgi:transketolase